MVGLVEVQESCTKEPSSFFWILDRILSKDVFSFLLPPPTPPPPHSRRQNVDPKIHTNYLVMIVCKRLGKKNYVGNYILITQTITM